ncbi:unnamed protein product [Rhizophagus irregularis]|nr:unnamed protein product [Rhizophagus irregularis]
MKPLNHNSDMIEMPIIKEQEALEPISYPENSTLHNNSQNDLKLRSQKNYPPLETSSIENDLISDSDIKHIVPEIDIQPLIQKLLIKPLEEDCVKVINVEESAAVDQLPAIELAYLYKKTKFAEIKTIRTKSDEIISWYCYRRYFEKRHSGILPGILKNRLITNKKAYELVSEQIYDEMLQHFSEVSCVNLRRKPQLTKPIYILFSKIGENKIMQIKSYSANKLSKLTDMQIDIIKTTLREKNSRTHVTSEMITSDATAPAKSKVRIPIAPTNSSVPVNSPVIPYDAHAPYINMTLKEYLYLFLYNSNKHND